VTLNNDEARDHLLRHGLNLFNKKIKLRRYDEVLNDEYIEYQQYEQLQQKLYVQRQQQEQNAASGDVEDDDDADELKDSAAVTCWDQEIQPDRSSRLDPPHKGPPTTAVSTPEPTQTVH